MDRCDKMSGSYFNINVDKIKSLCGEFDECKNDYINKAYSTLKNSYLANTGNYQISRVYNKLSRYYDDIKNDYDNIIKWWKDYITNVDALEKYLSYDGNIGNITDIRLKNLLNNIERPKEYNNEFANIFSSTSKNLSIDNMSNSY